jgi:hypothetical protein
MISQKFARLHRKGKNYDLEGKVQNRVPLIDSQHEELFRRVTDFVETVRGAGEWEKKIDKVNSTLAFMKDMWCRTFTTRRPISKKSLSAYSATKKYIPTWWATCRRGKEYEEAGIRSR